METLTLPVPRVESRRGLLSFPAAVGFFCILRVALTFLFFQANPVIGTALVVVVDTALVFGALLCTAGGEALSSRASLRSATLYLIAAYLALSLASLAWGGAQWAAAAVAYWAALAADVTVVLVMLRSGDMAGSTERLITGAVWGGVVLSLVGWCSPVTADLRLGNDEFLHPNTLGLEIGLCALLAQYLARRSAMWRWIAIGLAVTLLRTLSKTAIIAFLVAQTWWLLQYRGGTRAARIRIFAVALVVIPLFWGLLASYLDIYTSGQGRQLETLTGRTLLWAVVISMGLEHPWFGHGFYSFKSLVPALGDFVPVHAHNELLNQFFELGAAGAVIVTGIYTAFLLRARRSRRSDLRNLAIAVWIFAVVRGLTDAVSAELCFPLWLMTALTLCMGPTAEEASSR